MNLLESLGTQFPPRPRWDGRWHTPCGKARWWRWPWRPCSACCTGQRARYAAACVAMLALLTGFCVTYQICLAQQRIEGGIWQVPALRPAPPGLGDGPDRSLSCRAAIPVADEYLPWLAPIWSSRAFYSFLLRGMAGWMAARVVCAGAGCVPPLCSWQGADRPPRCAGARLSTADHAAGILRGGSAGGDRLYLVPSS